MSLNNTGMNQEEETVGLQYRTYGKV